LWRLPSVIFSAAYTNSFRSDSFIRLMAKFSKSTLAKLAGKRLRIAFESYRVSLEHFDAIAFVAHRVEDFAVAYALESGAHLLGSQNVAGRIYVIFLYTNFQNFC
jgi:hypothetical protein